MAEPQQGATYRGVSSKGIGKGFKKAAKDAENKARADLAQKGQWPPKEPITYKADMYVRIGNPIHEFIVELLQQPKEERMAEIAKVITVIGQSPESFAKAADVAVQEASKTLRGISGADVVSMSALVENDKISMYRTTVNIAFAVER